MTMLINSYRYGTSGGGGGGSTYPTEVAADSPIAYWRLGETSGTTAVDEQGSHDGTYVNTPTLGETGALDGGTDTAVRFTRANSEYVQVPDAAALDLTANFSIELWFKRAATTNYEFGEGLICKGVGAWTVSIDSSGIITFDKHGTGAVCRASLNPIADTNWHHVVVTMGANYTDTHIYLDGAEVPVTRTNRTFSTLTADLTIGITNDSSTGFSAGHAFDGTVDEVSVYGSKLSDARVAAHWEAGVPALSYPQTLTWDVDEYDGIVNWLGTQGEQTTFANPAWRAGGGSFTTSQSSTIDTVRTSAKATDHRLDANNGSVHTSNSAGEWWKVDFGSGATVTPTRLGIVGRSFGGLHPRNFKLQGSNDDSTWTDLLTVTADGPADGTWWSSAVSGASAYRYLRILQTGTNSGAGLHLTLGEIEVWGTISA